jgi:hypothetical protein
VLEHLVALVVGERLEVARQRYKGACPGHVVKPIDCLVEALAANDDPLFQAYARGWLSQSPK